MEKVEHGEEPMNVFWDPAKNACINLPRGKRPKWRARPKGQNVFGGNWEKYSPIRDRVEALWAKAEQAK